MNGFKGRFTSIKDISDRRRLPRLGKLRLGIKMKSTKTGKEFPREVDYFVCPPEVQKQFGEQPKELPIMFPIEDREVIFPQAYKYWGQSKGLKCIGNGENAIEFTEEGGVERQCPCELLEKGNCQRRAHLMILIPKVSCGGVYQVDLGSYHSIVDINSGLDYVRALVGRFSWVPLMLRRVPRETHGGDKKTTHYTLQIEFQGDIATINQLREDTRRILEGPRYALPAPIDENPKMDEGATIEYTDEEEIVIPEPSSQAETESEPSKTEEKPKNNAKQDSAGVYKVLLNQIKSKVIGTKNLEQAKLLVPKESDLEWAAGIALVNFLATLKQPIEADKWHEKRDEILGAGK